MKSTVAQQFEWILNTLNKVRSYLSCLTMIPPSNNLVAACSLLTDMSINIKEYLNQAEGDPSMCNCEWPEEEDDGEGGIYCYYCGKPISYGSRTILTNKIQDVIDKINDDRENGNVDVRTYRDLLESIVKELKGDDDER